MKRRILIIGSGFGGLGLAIRLKRAGIDSFTILEQSDTLGGTWRDNSYPGAACDVPSMLYCLSYDQKTDWTRKWSAQAEIREYMERVRAPQRHPAAHPLRRPGHRRAASTTRRGRGRCARPTARSSSPTCW